MSTLETDAKNFAVRIIKLRVNHPSIYTSDGKAFDVVQKEFRNIPLSGLRRSVGEQLAKLRKELKVAAREATTIKNEGVLERMAIMTALGKHPHIPYSEDMIIFISKIINDSEREKRSKLEGVVISHAEKTSND